MFSALRRLQRLSILVVALALVPAVAFAAPTKATAFDAVRVGMHEQQGEQGVTLSIAADVSPGTKLPAKIAVPVPAGASPYWVGEILGGDPSKDPDAQYTIEHGEGYDLVVFVLTKVRTGQVEMSLPGAATNPDGSKTLALSWTAAARVGVVRLGLQPPDGSAVSTATAGMAPDAASGSSVYLLERRDVKPGQQLSAELTYRPAAVAQAPAGGTPTTSTALIFVLALVAAGFAFAAVVVGSKTRSRRVPSPAEQALPTRGASRAAAEAEAGTERAPMRSRPTRSPLASPQFIITVLVLGVVFGLIALASRGPGVTVSSKTSVTRTLGSAQPKSSATFTVKIEGGDISHGATHVFDVLATLPGLNSATVEAQGPTLRVTFDPAAVTEAQIRAVLQDASLL